MHRLFIIALFTTLVVGCASKKADGTKQLVAAQNRAVLDAQQSFFPGGYDYKVGDFVLSLPIRYYEFVSNRLSFAEHISKSGEPRPAVQQEKYLTLPADALAPKRHYLLLDQRHLLIFSEHYELENGYPPMLEVLRRTSDAGWSEVTSSTVPAWAQSPKAVQFSPDYSSITVTSVAGENERLVWKDGELKAP